MRVCDLNTGIGRMTHAFSKLKEHWSAAKEVWRDEAARQFEEQHLKSVPNQMQFLLGAVQRLQEVVHQAARDLDDRDEVN